MRKKPSSSTRSNLFAWPGLLAAILVVTGAITLSLKGVDILGVVASATSSLTRAPVTLYLTPYDDQPLQIGEIKKIDVVVNAKVPINAVGTTLLFPQDSLEILGFTKEKSFFDLWTEETAINEEKGEVHFSGGTTRIGGMIGTGTVLTLTVRAKKSGSSELLFKDAQVYPSDGTGEAIDTDRRSLTFTVPELVRTSSYPTNVTTTSQPEKPLPRSADLNADGKINLVDISIMIMRVMAPYDSRFDLDMDGMIGLSDVSIVLSKTH